MSDQDPVIDPAAITLPPHVAADELIESSWGNAVVDALGGLNTGVTANTNALKQMPARIKAAKVTVTTNASGQGLITLPFAAASIIVNIDRTSYGYYVSSGWASFVAAELSPDGTQVNLTFWYMTATSAITAHGATTFVVHYIASSTPPP